MQSLEGDGDGGAHPGLAVQVDAGAVDAGDLLDDGKAEAGAAGGLAAALVHPVEPLKDAALRLFRDADAVVLHREIGVALPGAARLQQDPAAGVQFQIVSGTTGEVVATLTTDEKGFATTAGGWFGAGERPDGVLGAACIAGITVSVIALVQNRKSKEVSE